MKVLSKYELSYNRKTLGYFIGTDETEKLIEVSKDDFDKIQIGKEIKNIEQIENNCWHDIIDMII